jgi:hypothetical protein
MLASFLLIAPPTFGTVCLTWNCGQVGKRGDVSFNRRDNPRHSARRKFKDGKVWPPALTKGQVAARELFCPFKGFGSIEPFFLPEFGNPQPAARVSAGKRSCGELVA